MILAATWSLYRIHTLPLCLKSRLGYILPQTYPVCQIKHNWFELLQSNVHVSQHYLAFTTYVLTQVFVDLPFDCIAGTSQVLLVPLTHDGTIDTNILMKCLSQTRKEKQTDLPDPPIVVMHEDVPYFVDDIAQNMTPNTYFPRYDMTFGQYAMTKLNVTCLDMEQPMLIARQARSKPSFNQSFSSTKKRRSYVYLIPQLCTLHPLPAAIWNDAKHMPTMLYILEKTRKHISLQTQWKWTYSLKVPLTAPGANLEFNNDRLAFLGDAVLKLVISIDLCNKHGWNIDDSLKACRQDALQNTHLATIADQLGLAAYMDILGFKSSWYTLFIPSKHPPIYEKSSASRTKLLASALEAILGSAFLNAGMKGAMTMAVNLGLITTKSSKLPEVDLSGFDGALSPSSLWHGERLEIFLHREQWHNKISSYIQVPQEHSLEINSLKFLGEAIQYATLASILYRTGFEPSKMTQIRHHVSRSALGQLLLQKQIVTEPFPSLSIFYDIILAVIAEDHNVHTAITFAEQFLQQLVNPLIVRAKSSRSDEEELEEEA